jgi:hypothetical protein
VGKTFLQLKLVLESSGGGGRRRRTAAADGGGGRRTVVMELSLDQLYQLLAFMN